MKRGIAIIKFYVHGETDQELFEDAKRQCGNISASRYPSVNAVLNERTGKPYINK